MEILGIRLVGLNAANGDKFLITLGIVLGLAVLTTILRGLLRLLPQGAGAMRVRFWGRQVVSLAIAVVGVVALASVWFDNPRSLATALGLVTAGLAFALQKVVTSVAGYFLILRGNNFTVGDRIVMGGVRGNVISLGFFQTTILEMGEPKSVQEDAPAMWVKSRQFTGRIVTVANSRVFDDPIYNYTREFPFIWDEVTVPIAYRDDHGRAEQALLAAARKHAIDPQQVAPEVMKHLRERFDVQLHDFEPRVYWRLTDNWLEMTVRLLVHDHGTRQVKDAMAREILAQLTAAGIGVASSTSEIVHFPTLNVKMVDGPH